MAEASAVSELRPRRFRAKIVVIDDDVVVRGLLKLHLVNAGYDVLEAEDAIVGGHMVIAASPDLIVCDVHMPYMNGYEFVAALKSDPITNRIPVVFLTTDGDVGDHAKKLGAVAYLNKPVMADRLLEVVELTVGTPT
jgi:CheY-like chemotaxis protein